MGFTFAVAVTVMFDEQFSTIGGTVAGVTVTSKEQLVVFPHVSLAVHVTLVVPSGKVLPLGGSQTMVGN